MRIIVITVLSVVALGVLIFMARIWGLGQAHPQFQSDFFLGPQPAIIVKATSVEEARAISTLNKDAYIWLDVRISGDKVPFIMGTARDKEFIDQILERQKAAPQEKIMVGNKLSEYPLTEIEKYFGPRELLPSFYELLPHSRFILNVIDNTHEVHIAVTKAIADYKPEKRTLIQSDALVIMSAIKDINAEFIYGTSVPDIMRFLSMDSLWILPTTQFKGDIFIVPFKLKGRPAYNDNVIAEVKRRHKRIYIGPLTTPEELSEAKRIGADGYIFANLEEFLKLPNLGPAQ